ncbi:hypothetical protein KY320_02680, partial [Candidatus Woesearchaeota archaeon]|nr:hypothetical protein [Candidatus Woesearchaeota archaeon]
MKKLCLIILSILLVAPTVFALSASIGNARMILYPEIVAGKETVIEKTILVKNVNNVSIEVELTAHGDLEEMVEIIDSNFILEPFESREAAFTLTVTQPGRYEGNIAVAFSEYPENKDSSGV